MTIYPGFLVTLLAAARFAAHLLAKRFFWPAVIAISLALVLGRHTPAFLLFMGVALGPGEHRLTFWYRPKRFSWFLAIAGAYAVLLVAIVPRLVARVDAHGRGGS